MSTPSAPFDRAAPSSALLSWSSDLQQTQRIAHAVGEQATRFTLREVFSPSPSGNDEHPHQSFFE
jgi:hypothetical protein